MPYFHVVFTVPEPVATIAFQNQTVVYDILFRAASETLRTIAADPRHLGAEIGFLAVLHTWGQNLLHHPHLHCLVPGGGIAPDGRSWIACRSGFFLPVTVLSRMFRGLFLHYLAKAFAAGELRFFPEHRDLQEPAAFRRYLAPTRDTEWVVYAKRPFEAPSGEYFYAVTRNGLHEMAMLREHPLLIPSADMFHLRWLPMYNSLLGSSRLSLVRESLGLGIGLEEHQARFVGQGARTGGVLSTDQKFASKEIREQLREEWQRLQAGPRNSGATAILEQGLKWQALGLSMVDSQFIEFRNFQLRDIARAFDVPPYKLAIEGETEGPAMVQMGQQYLNGPISGYCERWKAKAEQFYELDGDDTFLDWDYGHFLKADLLSRFTAYRQAVGGPWMKVNEARRAEGLSSVPDGDTVQQAVNMAPLGWVPSARGGAGDQGSNQTGVPGEGGNGDPNRNPADDPAPGV